MAISIDWRDLRTLGGSQDQAFEELLCQLAHQEDVPAGSAFVRKGRPDAGVECFWTLPGEGGELAWQAKFFLDPLKASQWQQLDESVDTALDKHPAQRQYTVCIPQDRPDARLKGTQSLLQRWEARRRVWEGRAKKRGMNVRFEFWGTHEILQRLTQAKNAGRYRFWFDRDILTPAWFRSHVEQQVRNAGPRYTPEVNVDVPTAEAVPWATRSPGAIDQLYEKLDEVADRYHAAERVIGGSASGLTFGRVEDAFAPLNAATHRLPKDPGEPIGMRALETAAADALDAVRDLERQLLEHPAAAGYREKASSYDPLGPHKFRSEISELRRLAPALYQVQELAGGQAGILLDRPELFVYGPAGCGKTHMLCDIARERVGRGVPTVLLLGEQFAEGEPWSQVFALTRPGVDDERDFLGALDAAAEAAGERALIILDAVNEGAGLGLWLKHLGGFRHAIAQYPRVALLVSVRSPYHEQLFGDDRDAWPTAVRHDGFAEVLDDAADRYFDHYGIQGAAVPVLAPEFENPLFLKTFCRGMQNAGLRVIPEGLQGITAVLEFYVRSLRPRLFGDRVFDFDPHGVRVMDAVTALADAIGDTEHRWLPVPAAVRVLSPTFGTRAETALTTLVSEGLLHRDMFYVDRATPPAEGVRFGYERFTDHLVVRGLLQRHMDRRRPAAAFGPRRKLGRLCRQAGLARRAQGLVEALSVQVPERTGRELFELLPKRLRTRPIFAAFLQSLVWRRADAVTNAARSIVDRNVARDRAWFASFAPTLIQLTVRPSHPLNADYLHGLLMPMSMPQRDEWWSTVLHRNYTGGDPVSRLIRWAWGGRGSEALGDEAAEFAAVTLSWFLTSSNRFIRDRSTKALVRLLQDRLDVLRRLMRRFASVNDPYVAERLFAVAYGCAMRTRDDQGLGRLAADVLKHVFESGEVPAHVLLRDYAAGVVRAARQRGLLPDTVGPQIAPPFGREWPRRLPTLEELEPMYHGTRVRQATLGAAADRIWDSLGTWGDFRRYTIGSMDWKVQRVADRHRLTPREQVDLFAASLDRSQRANLINYQAELRRSWSCPPDERREEEARSQFRVSLDDAQQSVFDELADPVIRAYRDPGGGGGGRRPHLPKDLIVRFVLQRVIELGWTGQRFGDFDGSVSGWGRGEHKAERIGKKYQWIAYHEALGRLSDTFEYEEGQYTGPWQLRRRDIDPSVLLRSSGPPARPGDAPAWWNPEEPADIDATCTDEQWVRDPRGVPDLRKGLSVSDVDGAEWLVLDRATDRVQPHGRGQRHLDLPRRHLQVGLDAFFARRGDLRKLHVWARSRPVRYLDVPSALHSGDAFYGEHPWGPAWQEQRDHWATDDGWLSPQHLPVPVMPLADLYDQGDSGYDCSIEKSFAIRVPAACLVRQFGLVGRSMDGRWYSPTGELVAQDPSVFQAGPMALLFRKDRMGPFLRGHGLAVFWVLRGEKQMIGGGGSVREWLGRLLFQGLYSFDGERIAGNVRTWFHAPGADPDGRSRPRPARPGRRDGIAVAVLPAAPRRGRRAIVRSPDNSG